MGNFSKFPTCPPISMLLSDYSQINLGDSTIKFSPCSGNNSYVSKPHKMQFTLYAEQTHPMYPIIVLLLVIVTIWIVELQQSVYPMSLILRMAKPFEAIRSHWYNTITRSNQSQINICKLILSIRSILCSTMNHLQTHVYSYWD